MASLFFILARAAGKRYTHYKYVFIDHKVVKFMLNKIQESVCQLPIGFVLLSAPQVIKPTTMPEKIQRMLLHVILGNYGLEC